MAVASGPEPGEHTRADDPLPVRIGETLSRLLTGLRPGETAVTPDTQLKGLGLDSMTTARLWLALQEDFGIETPLGWFTEAATLGEFGARAAELAEQEGSAGETGGHLVTVTADPARASDPFPLTPLQQAYLAGRTPELTDDPVGCHLYREFDVPALDTGRLRAAWQRLIEHHEMLRSARTDDGRQQILTVGPRWEIPVSEPDPAAEPDDFDLRAARTRARMSHACFGSDASVLFAVEVTRRADGHARVHWSIDALITDGAGLDLLAAQWKALYEDLDQVLPSPPYTARDCLVALADRTHTAGHRRALAHWTSRLAELPGPPAVVRDDVAPRPPGAPGLRRRARSDRLTPAEWSAVRRRAAAFGVTPTSLVLTLFTEALARCGAFEPFSVTITTSRRTLLPSGADQLVGPFTSTVAVEAVLPNELTLEEAARQTHQELWNALEHSAVCGVTARRALRGRGADASPVVFTSMLDAAAPQRERGFADALVYATSQTSGVWLDHQMWERSGGLELRWDVADAMLLPGVPDAAFAAFRNALRTLAGDSNERERRPLNELQQAYYVARRTAERQTWSGCQVYVSYEVPGTVDLVRLEAALVRLAAAHDVLRSAVTLDGAVDVSAWAPEEWTIPVIEGASVEETREAMMATPFPPARRPQWDLRLTRGEDHDTVHLCLDLTLADAVSIHALGRSLMRLYARPQSTPETGEPYERHLRALRDRRAAPEQSEWRAHWEQALAGLPSGPVLGGPADDGAEPRRIRLQGRVAGWTAFTDRAARHGLTPDAALLTAFTDILSLYHDGDFAVPVVRWDGPDAAYRPGEFTALSWLARPSGDLPFTERARAHLTALTSDAAVPTSGLAQLRRRTATGETGHPVVYTSVLDLTGDPLPDGVRQGEWRTCTPNVSLDCITTVEDDGTLHYCWDVRQSDFDEADLQEWFSAYGAAVQHLVTEEEWDSPAVEGPAPLTEEERRVILHEWNDTAHEFDGDRLIHTAFEERARLTSEAVALRWRGGSMTFREVNQRANRLARELRSRDVGPETVVAVSLPRGPLMVAAVLGVLKAGGVYLPIEPGLPAERAAVVLEEAGCATVVTTSDRRGWLPPDGVAEVRADELPADPEADSSDPEPVAEPHQTAYIIFTSGSTGRPKGVAVAHRPVLNLLDWARRTFAFDASDLGLCVTSLGFDLSVFDVFGLLGYGAGLYIADEEQQRDPALLLDVLLSEPVTFWNSAPTTLAQIAPLLADHHGSAGTETLRLVFLSGDFTPLSLPGDVRAAFPRADLVSLGGATEATVWSNWFPIRDIDPEWRSIPYGRPLDNCRYHVLDDSMQPCPVGVEGDLYIGGECLALGYVNQPELTSERFLPDPFHDDPAERLYRTGDRASYFPDGNLCLHGRADGQVKIRGFRVELGEIEHRLRLHDAVKDVVVVSRGEGEERTLVAYVVPRGAAPAPRALRAHAAAALPDYMVPNFFGYLRSFPATANGKLDRQALPWPVPGPPEPGERAVPAASGEAPGDAPPDESHGDEPGTVADTRIAAASAGPSLDELRDEIAGLFADALGVPQVDPEADLWDQGATSFTMVQVSGTLQRRHHQRIPVSALLDKPYVTAIASRLHRGATDEVAAVARPAESSTSEGRGDDERPEDGEQPPVRAPHSGSREDGPGPVDFFSPEERARFKAGRWNSRPARPGEPVVPLNAEPFDEELYAWRASRRDFLDRPVPHADFCRLLSLLRDAPTASGRRRLHPSAGDTYAVQTYLHLTADAVTGIDEGLYHYDPSEHVLRRIDPVQRALRSGHFVYNREVFDRSRFGIYLVGRRPGIEPLYGEESLRYLTLEAGHMGQLLMMGQAAAGVGLCPIGALSFEGLATSLGLDEGHVFLQAFLGGAASHASSSAAGLRPPFGRPATTPVGTVAAVQTGPWPQLPAAPEPMAVIGMAGRFPGADDLDTFWDNLASGRSAVGPVPPSRGEVARGGTRPRGGFLDGIDRFESLLFHVSPAEAPFVDPQARLLLEAVWRCLEDAGHTAESLRLSAGRVGVFIGTMWQDHRLRGADHWADGGPARTPATASDVPNRISHFFDFQGPSMAVDTSCASSLAALHLAVESLRRGECGAAVVGAANLLAHPYHWGLLEGMELLATSGTPEAFPADGSGWYPGEGVAALLLRPAAAATDAGDVVHGLVEGTRMSHVGRAPRYGAPRAERLADSLSRALAEAGSAPGDIDYVECAAAGSGIADVAELEALSEVFATSGDAPRLPVGTLKPNIGHLEAASGLSQVIKVLLQMRHGTIAPTTVARRRNDLVDWAALPVEVVDRGRPWTEKAADGRRTALVNAVGATGSYGHAILTSRPPDREQAADAVPESATFDHDAGGPDTRRLLLLSADTRERLATAARTLCDHLTTHAANLNLPDVAWTLQTGRVPHAHRLALTARTLPGAVAGLGRFLDGQAGSDLRTGVADPAAGAADGDPARVVDQWLRGHEVDWARMWPVPGRRVTLPGHVFAGDRHRFGPPANSSPAPDAAPLPPEAEPASAAGEQALRRAERYLTDLYAEASGIPAERLHPQVPLEQYGLTSLLVSRLNARLQAEVGPVTQTVFYEYRDLAGVADHLVRLHDGPWTENSGESAAGEPADGKPAAAAAGPAVPAPPAPAVSAAPPAHGGTPEAEPLAVVGLAGRYPQAPDLREFWRNLEQGRDCVTPVPPDRPVAACGAQLMHGGFLDGVDRFDPLFFGITPRDARLMDPQERLFLEVVWEALEDGGYSRARLRERIGSRVGVFAGTMYNEYPFFGVERSLSGEPEDTGSAVAGIANRVSYLLDLSGPSMAVDTMCSSSLTALHLAAQSLRRGECSAAVVGGVNLSLHPHKFRQQARLGMTSSDHRCRSFGADGDGFAPAEGVGALLLRPLGAALADGDRIHAVIRGTSVNHGGRTTGYMVPNPAAQAELVLRAVRESGVDPSTIGYLEAHGTGTRLGDPIEISGLTTAFADAHLPPGSCAIGSVKSNIGHPEAAAGIAGLTKVILQMRHRRLAPSLHSRELNPAVDWETSPFRVVREAEPWHAPVTADGAAAPRRAGLSSFGAGGANVHVVVEEHVPAPDGSPPRPGGSEPDPQLIVLSATHPHRLREVARRLAERLRTDEAAGERAALPEVAYTLQVGREGLRERLAVVVAQEERLLELLDEVAAGRTPEEVLRGRVPGDARPVGVCAAPRPGKDRLAELRRVAVHWVAGGDVTWDALHAERRRLVSLPSYPFLRDRYWLPAPAQDGPEEPGRPGPSPGTAAAHLGDPQRRRSVEAEPSPTLHGPALYTSVWTPEALPPGVGALTGRVVCVFTHRTEALARALAVRLGSHRVTLVLHGTGAALGGDILDDESAADRIAARCADGADGAGDVAALVDLCDAAGGQRADDSAPWTARLRLLQRLVRVRRGHDLRVLLVTEGLHRVPDTGPALDGARMAGFVRMLGAENARVSATVVDVPAGGTHPERAARLIHAEMLAGDGLTEVCHDGEVRRRRRLVALPASPARPVELDPHRAYLVTGGTGGIGAAAARRLVRRGARLVALTGHRPVPPRAQWSSLDPDSRDGAVAALVRDLEAAGAHVLLHAGSLADIGRSRAFLDRVRDELGPLGGVLHCAGRGPLGTPSFAGKSVADVRAVMEPKAEGVETLARLCASDELDFFVLFSSLSAVSPLLARGVSDYAAANAFLDYFAEHRALGLPGLRSVNWPTWSQNGMGADHPDGCAPAGVGSLSEEEGLRLLERLLTLPPDVSRVVVCPPLDSELVSPDALLGADPTHEEPLAPGRLARPGTAPSTPGAVPDISAPTAADVTTALPGAPYAPSSSALQSGAQHTPSGSPVPQPSPVEQLVTESQEDALAWLTPLFAEVLAIDEADLDPTVPFGDLGVESVMLGELVFRMEEATAASLDPAVLLEHPTLHQLASHLEALGVRSRADVPRPSGPAPAPATGAPPVEDHGGMSGRVAVIGMAGRFPGAPDVAAFWDNLVAGRCSVTEVPPSRWDVRDLYRTEYAHGRSVSKWGGFVEGVEYFDPDWFGMTEAEAVALDPVIRLFLEEAATCLTDAGYREQELAGRAVGVFAGARTTGYGRRARTLPGGVGMGGDQNFVSARVAHRFDFRGPNVVVDTACSSSLVALQAACRSLREGESEMALAGGVDVLLDEEPYLDFSAAHALSRVGRCATFDENADGFVPGEGCAVVLLKPLESALRDGDRVHAVIESVAVNNDGRTMGLTTPNPVAQAEVIGRALTESGLRARDIGMIEAHGTGTMIGDPIELRALTEAFRRDTDLTGFCAVGSAKSNVGHLLSASGMAGLVKAVLAVREGVIPPTLFCDTPNPRFDFDASPFFPNRVPRTWTPPAGGRRIAGVSAFGLGGTNAHILVGSPESPAPSAPAPRSPLPAPEFRRRRLWLERESVSVPEPASAPGPAHTIPSARPHQGEDSASRPSLTTSLLDIGPGAAASAGRWVVPASRPEGQQC
ncbi:amino acid adenylation domain-containing protein [Streptomyces sp. RKND-216]|uniref:non-ribosomal peptide synthetase n=1 Tax=Streptomyces sp. RKND-216 TaxID=2562581 RepID=UPI00109E29ED|nr:non-ribosomal peptide synthetase [Streptomyces sp. RKND-216]THA24096.1 amino acid adenylation domain-containing protein [Streptomyces sp. RKND-216]